jgi:hypothetical protein
VGDAAGLAMQRAHKKTVKAYLLTSQSSQTKKERKEYKQGCLPVVRMIAEYHVVRGSVCGVDSGLGQCRGDELPWQLWCGDTSMTHVSQFSM